MNYRNWSLTPIILSVAFPLFAATSEYKVELPAELRRMASRGALSPAVTHAIVTIAVPDKLAPEADAPVLIVSATEPEGTSHGPLFDPSFAPQGCVIAGDEQGFVAGAVRH